MLPDEETTQQTEVEATPPIVEEPTGVEAEATDETQEQTTSEAESPEITPERIQELQQFEQRYKDIESHKTQIEQQNAELRAERNRQQEALRVLGGHVQQQQDPVESAYARLEQARESYDPATIRAAERAYHDARDTRIARVATDAAVRVQRTNTQMQDARRYGDYTEEQLSETLREISPADIALIRRNREGNLREFLNTDAEKAKVEAERAQRANTFFGNETPGTVPGAPSQNVTPTIEWANFVTELTKKQQAELVEKGVRILNAPGSD